MQYFPVQRALLAESLHLAVTSIRDGSRAARSEKKKRSRPREKTHNPELQFTVSHANVRSLYPALCPLLSHLLGGRCKNRSSRTLCSLRLTMLGLSDGGSRSSRMLAFVLAAILLNSPAPVVFGLITTPGSPCTDVCGKTTNTTSSEVACADQSYNQTSVGRTFRDCVSCQLDSKFNDENTGESDVNWGLCMSYHLPKTADCNLSLRSNHSNQITCATLFQPVCLDFQTRSQISRHRAQ